MLLLSAIEEIVIYPQEFMFSNDRLSQYVGHACSL